MWVSKTNTAKWSLLFRDHPGWRTKRERMKKMNTHRGLWNTIKCIRVTHAKDKGKKRGRKWVFQYIKAKHFANLTKKKKTIYLQNYKVQWNSIRSNTVIHNHVHPSRSNQRQRENVEITKREVIHHVLGVLCNFLHQ